MSGASSEPAEADRQAERRARSTKSGTRTGGRWSSSRPCSLVGGVDHGTVKAVAGEDRQQVEIRREVGEQHAQSASSVAAKRRQRLRAGGCALPEGKKPILT